MSYWILDGKAIKEGGVLVVTSPTPQASWPYYFQVIFGFFFFVFVFCFCFCFHCFYVSK